MPYYTYDKKIDQYYEYGYIHPDIIENMRVSGRWFIEDEEIINQIKKINPAGFRRFIKIKDGKVSIDVDQLRSVAKDDFRRIRSEILPKLDAKIFQYQEQQITAGSNESLKAGLTDKIIEVANLKQAWRDIPENPYWESVTDWETYTRSFHDLRYQLDPWYKEEHDRETGPDAEFNLVNPT